MNVEHIAARPWLGLEAELTPRFRLRERKCAKCGALHTYNVSVLYAQPSPRPCAGCVPSARRLVAKFSMLERVTFSEELREREPRIKRRRLKTIGYGIRSVRAGDAPTPRRARHPAAPGRRTQALSRQRCQRTLTQGSLQHCALRSSPSRLARVAYDADVQVHRRGAGRHHARHGTPLSPWPQAGRRRRSAHCAFGAHIRAARRELE